MGFVILDLEFNNMRGISQYFPDIIEDNLDNMMENEIIEIGAVKYDVYMKELEELKCYIKPGIFKVLNPKVKEMTGITEEDLEKGISFSDAMNKLKEFCGTSNTICSWAKDDIAELIINSNYHGYKDINWINKYLDIQEYCTKVLAHKKSLSLKSALEELRIKVEEEKLHDALNDAKYTAEVFKRLYNSRVVKNYVVNDVYNMPAVMIRDFKDVILEDNKTEFKCPRCHIEAEKEHPLKLFSWRFLALGLCPKCKSRLLQEVVIKKSLSGQKIYSNISTIINESDYLNYSYRFKKIG
ncbi:3'-5' exonuclease [Clostridium polynesiense]|uniref:3'-5' exonuclease n=1 Tax=Clostridium polynesiense TaxID=1325933 RepID=UPI00058C6BC0|nr:3'-5' exonuclease [Clostridium polynesiense]